MLQRVISRRAYGIRHFSTHSRVAVIGGGTAGMAARSQLAENGVFRPEEISVFEPRETHLYQPSFTMIGGGVLGNNQATVKKKEFSHIKRPTDSLFHTGVNLIKEKVVSLDPENNSFTTNKGQHTYEYLVIAPGLKLRYDLIEGASEALDDPDHPVVSIYREDYAYKTLKHRENFTKGTALFYQPPFPIKCGGAPQKILYLSESRWRELGTRGNIDLQYYTAANVMFPPCEKYSMALDKLRTELGIPVHFEHVMKAVDKNSKEILFTNTSTGKEHAVKYDFLHLVPPQTNHDFIINSPLAGAGGWTAADQNSMQNPNFPNVFSVGDSAGVPSSKTAASTFAQVPVMVENLVKHSQGEEVKASFSGYGSCPLFTGDNKLMLAEFKYGGASNETFYSKQDIPSRIFYQMKKDLFPWIYFNLVPKGQWYGNKTVFKPRFF
ncbi:unnamed protein product [Moneuplotes crassus]|uniref:FAD/NAD(P)-binding domain-containing protein n=1 Tax=Euplotes crassus TaxID=5936 RepID=A0AAD1UIZ6_EUPCR|nr:unnamed protein product [Moneuplotes crassus]